MLVDVGSEPSVVYRIDAPAVAHAKVNTSELVATMPDAGDIVGVATVWMIVYAAVAIALSAIPDLKALALIVADWVRVTGSV